MQTDSLLDLIQNFPDNDTCYKQLVELRWGANVVCPHCNSERVYSFKGGKTWKCANNTCYKKFNVLIGTIFEASKVPLRKWFIAIYIHLNHKKGISSCQLSRDLKVSQKCAWFMLGRIRELTQDKGSNPFTGIVEVDETFIGGRAANKHRHVRKELLKEGTGYVHKTPVVAILQRDGQVYTQVIAKAEGTTLKPIIRKHLAEGATLVTDTFGGYHGLSANYKHVTINHSKDEFTKGEFHTNSVEGFFSQMKRGIFGIYHHVSPQHLHRYANEFSFRHNTRNYTENDRFMTALSRTNGNRLKYVDYIAVSK